MFVLRCVWAVATFLSVFLQRNSAIAGVGLGFFWRMFFKLQICVTTCRQTTVFQRIDLLFVSMAVWGC